MNRKSKCHAKTVQTGHSFYAACRCGWKGRNAHVFLIAWMDARKHDPGFPRPKHIAIPASERKHFGR